MNGIEAARAALRSRQGPGARYDAPNAPGDDLLLARRATAHFARLLSQLDHAGLTPARRRIIAHIGYHARAMARLVEWARTGVPLAMYPSMAARDAEIASGATLPARALHSLFQHAVIHLDVEWRDLPEAGWDAQLTLLDGQGVKARELPRLRAVELWNGALGLDCGVRASDVPASLREHTLAMPACPDHPGRSA